MTITKLPLPLLTTLSRVFALYTEAVPHRPHPLFASADPGTGTLAVLETLKYEQISAVVDGHIKELNRPPVTETRVQTLVLMHQTRSLLRCWRVGDVEDAWMAMKMVKQGLRKMEKGHQPGLGLGRAFGSD